MKNIDKKFQIYIASPLFCPEDHAELDRVESTLDRLGISYFSPRKDSNVGGDLRAAKTAEERDAIAQRIFSLNDEAIHQSKMLLVNTVGTRWHNAIYGDQGTLVEAGIAFEANIPVVTFNFHGYGLNIMLSQKSIHHYDDISLDDYSSLDSLKPMIDQLESYPFYRPDGWRCKDLRKKFYEIKDRELV